jgi:hypothetical protein
VDEFWGVVGKGECSVNVTRRRWWGRSGRITLGTSPVFINCEISWVWDFHREKAL